MPGYDRTGPMGQGPRSGRGLGQCGASRNAGFNMGRKGGFGQGRGGRRRFLGKNNDIAMPPAQHPLQSQRGGRCAVGRKAYDARSTWSDNLADYRERPSGSF